MKSKKILRIVGGLLVIILALSGSVGAYVYTQINPEMATFVHDGMTFWFTSTCMRFLVVVHFVILKTKLRRKTFGNRALSTARRTSKDIGL